MLRPKLSTPLRRPQSVATPEDAQETQASLARWGAAMGTTLVLRFHCFNMLATHPLRVLPRPLDADPPPEPPKDWYTWESRGVSFITFAEEASAKARRERTLGSVHRDTGRIVRRVPSSHHAVCSASSSLCGLLPTSFDLDHGLRMRRLWRCRRRWAWLPRSTARQAAL